MPRLRPYMPEVGTDTWGYRHPSAEAKITECHRIPYRYLRPISHFSSFLSRGQEAEWESSPGPCLIGCPSRRKRKIRRRVSPTTASNWTSLRVSLPLPSPSSLCVKIDGKGSVLKRTRGRSLGYPCPVQPFLFCLLLGP